MSQNATAKLGERIKLLRSTTAYTQATLSEVLGNEPETISRWERGEHAPSIETLEQVARILGYTVEDFFAPSGAQPQTVRELRHSLCDIAYEIEDVQTLGDILKSAKKIAMKNKKMVRSE
jgi:transcriptional regulator with XRE-family HTH domain